MVWRMRVSPRIKPIESIVIPFLAKWGIAIKYSQLNSIKVHLSTDSVDSKVCNSN